MTSHESFGQKPIVFYSSRTVDLPAVSVRPFIPDLGDTILSDTIYQVRGTGDLPVAYHRNIQTSVCFDNKCRLLHIVVHWNVTGRYLGFELPSGEFLSKKEHEPFVRAEYEKLHSILSDPFSPLGEIEYNELVPAQHSIPAEIDAVSSATASNLLEFVVEGAAFTTYKLWQIVYGTTRDEVSRLTEEELTESLWLQIVQSQDVSDRVWALERRSHVNGSSINIRDAILASIRDENYNVAESAIRAVTASDLQAQGFSLSFVRIYDSVSHALKKPILIKLKEAPRLDPATTKGLGDMLSRSSADLVGTILGLLLDKQVHDDYINHQVAALLQNPNFFIARQAFDFLEKVRIEDDEITTQIGNFKKQHNLK